MPDVSPSVLVVVDVQRGFADPVWGRGANPACEDNVAELLAAWRSRDWPVVLVRHDSVQADSPLRPGQPGNDLTPLVDGPHDLLVTKTVNSAFYGTPDLDGWLRERGHDRLVVCGITTNHCCETTTRMAGNLGYDTTFVLDATRAFDLPAPDGTVVPAEEVMRVTGANLDGEFARVTSTAALLEDLAPRQP
jgi:nicotinamidase-related amidase